MVSGVNFIELNQKNKAKQQTYDKQNNRIKAKIMSDHINYIGRCEGAENNGEHSLFGTLANENHVDQMPKKEVLAYIRDKVKNGAYVYKTVISIKQEEAEKYGFIEKTDFENLIRSNISNIGREYKIPFDNLDWVASLHTEKGHIHVHLDFFDNQKERKVAPFVQYDKIKKELNKGVYKEELSKIYESKNIAKKSMKEVFKQEIDSFTSMDKNKMFDHKVSEKNLNEITSLLRNLYEAKKEEYNSTGKSSFKLKYQTKEVKEQIRLTTIKILHSSVSIKENVRTYIQSCLEAEKIKLAGINGKRAERTLKQISVKAEEEMLTKIDNQILDFIKEVIREENFTEKLANISNQSNYNGTSNIKRAVNSLLMAIHTLTAETSENQRNMNKKAKTIMNSKAAKREWALKHRDVAMIDWQEEQ